jgi:hypothetical protein
MLDLVYLIAALLIVLVVAIVGIAPIYANHHIDPE